MDITGVRLWLGIRYNNDMRTMVVMVMLLLLLLRGWTSRRRIIVVIPVFSLWRTRRVLLVQAEDVVFTQWTVMVPSLDP